MSTATTHSLKRRRWYQYSLRTLLLLVVPVMCVATWLNQQMQTAQQQTEAVRWVRELRGELEFDPNTRDHWRSYMLGDYFPGVVRTVEVDLRGPQWAADFYPDTHLPGLPFLAEALQGNRSVVDNIDPLASLTDLRELHVIGWDQDDIRPLGNLHQLELLSLTYSHVQDISPLAELDQLEELSLRNTSTMDLSPLAGLENLKKLNLRNCPARDFRPLAKIATLEWLTIETERDTDLSPLYQLEHLQLLALRETSEESGRMTTAQLKEVRAAMPHCAVVTYLPGQLGRRRPWIRP